QAARGGGRSELDDFLPLPAYMWRARSALERRLHQGPRLLDELGQVIPAAEALRVDLVEVLGAGGTVGETAALRGDLDPADLGPVGGGLGEDLLDGLAGQGVALHVRRGELLEAGLLRGGGRLVHAGVDRLAVLRDDLAVVGARILAGGGGDLRRQQRQQDAVLVGGPD